MWAAALRHGRLRRPGRVRAPPSAALATSCLVRSAFPPPTKRPELLGLGCPLVPPARVSKVMGRGRHRVEPRGGSQPRRETTMIFRTRHVLGWAAGGLLLIAVSAQPASAAGPVTPNRPVVPP